MTQPQQHRTAVTRDDWQAEWWARTGDAWNYTPPTPSFVPQPVETSQPAPGHIGDVRISSWVGTTVRAAVAAAAAGTHMGAVHIAAMELASLSGYGYTERDDIEARLRSACAASGLLVTAGDGAATSAQLFTAMLDTGWSAGLADPYELPAWMYTLKRMVRVDNVAVANEWLRDELGRGKLSSLLLRDGELIFTPRVGEDGYVPLTDRETAAGAEPVSAQIQAAGVDHVKTLVENRHDVGKVVPDKEVPGARKPDKWVRAMFPREGAVAAVASARLGDCESLRRIRGITHTPMMRADGTVLEEPGYDTDSSLLYLPIDGLVVPEIPIAPTEEQVADAVAFLLVPVEKFPFVTENHLANYMGAMFTPLMRELLPPPYQMLVLTATNSGSGKGLLLKMLGSVHEVVMRGEMPREEAELGKSILSTLISTTQPVVAFDNVRGTIHSAHLEALLTSARVSDRILGESRQVSASNDRLWAMTGNNVAIGGDLARRCLKVALDPRCPDPHKRKFDLAPESWLKKHQGEYIAALLTVIRGWTIAGSPREINRSDDYAFWDGSLRGMLHWADIPGTFGDAPTGTKTISEDDAEWSIFVDELQRVFGESTFIARDIVNRIDGSLRSMQGHIGGSDIANYVSRTMIDPDTLPGDLPDKWGRFGATAGFARSIGKWLGYRDGRYTSDGLTVRAEQQGKKATTYRIEKEGAIDHD